MWALGEGPATVIGAGPYELYFDSGEVFELGSFAAPVSDGARVYARIEQQWTGPQDPDPRVVLWTLVNDTERGVFARAWWHGTSTCPAILVTYDTSPARTDGQKGTQIYATSRCVV